MRTSILSDLVGFILKSHHELSHLNFPADDRRFTPLYYISASGDADGTRVSCSMDRTGKLVLVAVQNGRTYEAVLPYKEQGISDLTATVKLSNQTSTTDMRLAGKEFLKGDGLPEEFKGLHQMIIRYVQRQFGWLTSNDGADQAAGNSNPEKDSDAVAGNPSDKGDTSFRIRQSRGPDLEFIGKRIGFVRSLLHNGRHWGYSVFETKGGNIIGLKEGLSMWLGEQAKVDTLVVRSRDAAELTEFFGDSQLARTLYEQIGRKYVTVID